MRKFTVFIVMLLVLSFIVTPVIADAPPTKDVLRIPFASNEALAELAGQLDIWEVQRDAVDAESGYVVAYLSTGERAWLTDAGFASTLADMPAHPATIPGFACYRTIDELFAQLDQWAAEYADITDLSTIGYSYEGRPLKVMRLTNEASGYPKPVFFMMSNIHGRELITPETAMKFIKHFLEGYGVDPDVTWLLDEQLIYVLVSANPDGHIKNELGQPWAYWRKNTQPYGSCSASDYGADLNRNFEFKWGGASTNPCAETYQGPSAASESETQVVQDFVRGLFPDQRGPADTDAAPDDATGVLLTLHSYSDLILWPWGHIYGEAPNHAQLQMLGRRMASFNGYTPEQASDLYPTTGSTDDWSYGELGVASFTYEIGSSGDGFYPACSRYDDLVYPNVAAMLYAAKVARTPYITSFGPHVRSVSLVTDTVLIGNPLLVEARVEDHDSKNPGENVVAAEVYIDVPPWDGGTPYSLTAADGAFNSSSETATGHIPTLGVTRGRHTLYVRGRDAEGFWGPVTAAFVTMRDEGGLSGTVTDADSGTPLADALIVADNGATTYTTLSDAAGMYMLALFSDTYTVTVALLGYADSVVTLPIATGTAAAQDFTLTRLPWGTLTLALRELGTGQPLTGVLTLAGSPLTWTVASSMTLELPSVSPGGVYTFTAHAPLHHPRSFSFVMRAGAVLHHTFRLPPTPALLVVDDDLGQDYETYVLPLLDTLHIPYEVWNVDVRGTVLPDVLARYQGALWLTGDDAVNSLTRAEQRLLVAFLESGGRLLVSGQNIGADIADDFGDFYSDVLHARFVQDDAGVDAVRGLAFFEGITATWSGGTSAGNQTSVDVVAAVDGVATPVFTATAGATGLAVETDVYRLIYLSYGLEGIGAVQTRSDILLAGLEWLALGYPPARLPLDLALNVGAVYQAVPATYTLSLVNDSLLDMVDGEVVVTLPTDVLVLDAGPATPQGAAGTLTWAALALPSEATHELWWTVMVSEATALDAITCTVAATWPRLSEPAWVQQRVPVKGPLAYGAELVPPTSHLTGAAGAVVTHSLTLTNIGNVATTFMLTATPSLWPVSLIPMQMTLAAGRSAPISVRVAVPEAVTLLLHAPNVVTVTAAVMASPTLKGSSVLTTALPFQRVFLPLVMRQ